MCPNLENNIAACVPELVFEPSTESDISSVYLSACESLPSVQTHYAEIVQNTITVNDDHKPKIIEMTKKTSVTKPPESLEAMFIPRNIDPKTVVSISPETLQALSAATFAQSVLPTPDPSQGNDSKDQPTGHRPLTVYETFEKVDVMSLGLSAPPATSVIEVSSQVCTTPPSSPTSLLTSVSDCN